MRDKFEIKEYFSDRELIKILCRKRSVLAKKCHDDHFFRNISRKAKSPHKRLDSEIYTFFPSRNNWIRLKKQEREKRSLNSIETNSIQLERTVWREISKHRRLGTLKPPWLIALLDFIEAIRDDVFNAEKGYQLSSPRIIPVLKDKNLLTFRPISVFLLKDLIITSQIAKYLSNCFDPLFSDSSYAFRTNVQRGKKFNHHKAIEDIIKFKREIGTPLFVAECDIKKFYDCVNHSKILEEFHLIMDQANEKLGIKIDIRAIHFFHSYLNSFSFNEDINKKEGEILSKAGISRGTIPWVKDSELLDVGTNPLSDRVGVPQGGAISCLIANILLNKVDNIINDVSDENTFYGRFCDDMVLMNTSKEKCQEQLELYQTALKDVKLISHKPAHFNAYGNQFWDEELKSKLPYKWDSNNHETITNVPWLSFVGYQIKYDGFVRVRKKSIRKELKKQVSETDKILDVVRKNPRINKLAIKFRLQQRLISMSISRFRFGSSKTSMCWCSGFKVLKYNRNITNQIRRLDRNREKQLNRLELHLTKINTPCTKAKKKIIPLKYYGYNYSYHKQFI